MNRNLIEFTQNENESNDETLSKDFFCLHGPRSTLFLIVIDVMYV